MKNYHNKTDLNRALRRKRVRAQISGTADLPRLSVFRSIKGIEAQLIDDTVGKTLLRVSSKEATGKGTKIEAAEEVGKLLAKKAKDLNIEKAVFDRRHYKYHGRIKALADSARAEGLKL
ncbi:MAG: 50S ribosomal protein L18 [Patescibacteria group bacterium]